MLLESEQRITKQLSVQCGVHYCGFRNRKGAHCFPSSPRCVSDLINSPLPLHDPQELFSVTQPTLIYSSYFPVPSGADTLSGVLKSQDPLLIIVFALSLICQHQAIFSRGKNFFQSTLLNILPHFFILLLRSGGLCPSRENRRDVLGVCGDSFPLVPELALIACVFPNICYFYFCQINIRVVSSLSPQVFQNGRGQ